MSIWQHLCATSTLSTPLELILARGNVKLDLREKSDRKKAVTEILSCALNANKPEKIGRFGGQIHDKYARDALRYALILHDSEFATTLSYINKQFIQMKVQKLDTTALTENFIELLLNFFPCPVLLKYIFRKKPNLWKPLLSSIISALMSIPFCLENNAYCKYHCTLTIFMQTCIYHWREQHFLFIINKVCKLFKQNIIALWDKYENQIYSQYIRQNEYNTEDIYE
eukprot:437629_1